LKKKGIDVSEIKVPTISENEEDLSKSFKSSKLNPQNNNNNDDNYDYDHDDNDINNENTSINNLKKKPGSHIHQDRMER